MRLFAFDRSLGFDWVAGADEAGRGCLAGPIVAAAVGFDYSKMSLSSIRSLENLDDSKRRKGAAREKVFTAVIAAADAVAVAIRPAAVIDRDGLHVTNLAALSDALSRIARPEGIALSDGFAVQLDVGRAEKLIGGDGRSAAIAAASIVAKVVRDRFMLKAAESWPEYGFESHVGYATADHRAAIATYGATPLHRLSFNSDAYKAAKGATS